LGRALTILAVPHVYEISYIGGVHVKAGVMALCVTFGLLHKIAPTILNIYILNNVPKTTTNLPNAPMLSAVEYEKTC